MSETVAIRQAARTKESAQYVSKVRVYINAVGRTASVWRVTLHTVYLHVSGHLSAPVIFMALRASRTSGVVIVPVHREQSVRASSVT